MEARTHRGVKGMRHVGLLKMDKMRQVSIRCNCNRGSAAKVPLRNIPTPPVLCRCINMQVVLSRNTLRPLPPPAPYSCGSNALSKAEAAGLEAATMLLL